MMITDFYDDSNLQQLYAFEHLTGVPEFVKSASPDQPKIAALPSEAFADPANRKFPCHTKAATWLANAYFQHNKGFYSVPDTRQIESRLQKFASYWKIVNLIEQFNAKYEKMANFHEPANIPDSQYALVYNMGDQVVKRMPMPTPASVKAAAEYLFANRHMYTFPMRKMAARRIMRRAVEFDDMYKAGSLDVSSPGTRFAAETQDYLERAAGFGMTHPALAAEKIAQRVLMVRTKHPEIGAKMAELALELSEKESTTPAELEKLAALIDVVDRETGLCQYYQQGVDMPEEFLFDVLEKDAEDVLDSQVMLTTGNAYPLGLIMQMPVEKMASVLGDDFVDAVSTAGTLDALKVAEIVPTLPRNDATVFEKAIVALATEPIEKGARAARASGLLFDKSETMDVLGGNAKDGDFSLVVKLPHSQQVKQSDANPPPPQPQPAPQPQPPSLPQPPAPQPQQQGGTPKPASKPEPVQPAPQFRPMPVPPVRVASGGASPQETPSKGALLAHIAAHGAPYNNAKQRLMAMSEGGSKSAEQNKEGATALGRWIAKSLKGLGIKGPLQYAQKGINIPALRENSGALKTLKANPGMAEAEIGGEWYPRDKARTILKSQNNTMREPMNRRYQTIAGTAAAIPLGAYLTARGLKEQNQEEQQQPAQQNPRLSQPG